MMQSKLFSQTLRETPKDADVVSQKLMLKAGLIQKLNSGIYSYLPLFLRSIRKLENIIREELNKEGCQELLMPMVQPAELWQESGRWSLYSKELLRFTDRKEASFCLGPTHEEVVTDIVRKQITSYKQLPISLYQIQTKFRDEIRPRFGLMRGREFIMKDGYSFHVDDKDADNEYWRMYDAYKKIFSRLGVSFRPVEADSGAIGGSFTHEFHVLAQSGEDAILSCDHCEYTSNVEKSECKKRIITTVDTGKPLLRKFILTPNVINFQEQLQLFTDESGMKIPIIKTSKFYLYKGRKEDIESVIGVVVRGDHFPNETKIRVAAKVDSLELLPLELAEEITGCCSGFMGPVGLKNIPVYVDFALEGVNDLTCGANENSYHHLHFSPSRDIDWLSGFYDLRLAEEGDECTRCESGHYQGFRGIEVGQVFKLGTKYSEKMKCCYLDSNGISHPMVMGCYGIGVTRTLAAVIEQNHDEKGIIWPWSVAPYQVHILNLKPENEMLTAYCCQVENLLKQHGYEVLVDDRIGIRAGVKFNDSELLGIPIRIVLGEKCMASNLVEAVSRRTLISEQLALENLCSWIEQKRKEYE